MDRLFNTVAALGRLKFRWDDDFTDRLSRVYSCIILVFFSIMVSGKQYVGDAIVCWIPGHWPSAHSRYTDNVCWIINTYFITSNEAIPTKIPDRADRQIGYYQWVPFALLFQALLFYIPCMVWRGFSEKSGINLKSIIEHSVDTHNVNNDTRKKTVNHISRHLAGCLNSKTKPLQSDTCWKVQNFINTRLCCLICGIKHGNFISVLYVLVKLLYVANAVSQLVFMNIFLGGRHTFYGVQYFVDLAMGRDWTESGRFPRVTMCDFVIRVLGNQHRHTVQCVLPINLFNEKIYLFLWWWTLVVGLFTIIGSLGWCFALTSESLRIYYINKHLQLTGASRAPPNYLKRFVVDYLRVDGILTMRLVEKNAGCVVTSLIIQQMWKDFMEPYTHDGESNYHTDPKPKKGGYIPPNHARPLRATAPPAETPPPPPIVANSKMPILTPDREKPPLLKKPTRAPSVPTNSKPKPQLPITSSM